MHDSDRTLRQILRLPFELAMLQLRVLDELVLVLNELLVSLDIVSLFTKVTLEPSLLQNLFVYYFIYILPFRPYWGS